MWFRTTIGKALGVNLALASQITVRQVVAGKRTPEQGEYDVVAIIGSEQVPLSSYQTFQEATDQAKALVEALVNTNKL